MSSLPANLEREGFSARLMASLKLEQLPTTTGAFTREFNLRADGAAVTVHAVRKWFDGGCIPTQDKVQIIARWVGVSAQWLRYGDTDEVRATNAELEPRDYRMINDLRLLRQTERNLVEQMVEALLSAQQYSKLYSPKK